MRTQLRFLACLFFLLAPVRSAFASHIVGADLRYQWVAGNTYKVILALYADCGPASAGAFAGLPTAVPKICVYNGSAFVTNFNLAIEAPSTGTDVTPTLCPGDTSQCTSMMSATPGIMLFIYSADVTLPSTSAAWRFVFTGDLGSSAAGRASAITNLATAGATTIYLEDTLNNSVAHNTNPVLNIVPLPYYGMNMWHAYNPVAVDAEGDSLVYSLDTVISGASTCSAGTPAAYIAGTSPSAPLLTAPGAFAFSSVTGQTAFYPNVTQRAVVIYHIREFRGGVLIGTIQREMTVLIMVSTNSLPAGGFSNPVACALTDTVSISVCDSVGAFSAEIHPTDADAADTIYVTPLGIPAGATFTTVGDGTPSPVSTFSWNAATAGPGVYTFFVKYNDNACPMSGTQTLAYTVKVTDCSLVTPPPPPTVVAELQEGDNGIRVFPNPSNGTFTIAMAAIAEPAAITITDVYGRVVSERIAAAGSSNITIDLHELAGAAYIVRVVANDKVYTERISIYK